MKKSEKWYDKGIKFECQGSGKCCTSHGEYGYVFFTLKDRQRMAKHLDLSTAQFTKQFLDKSENAFSLKENPDNPDCIFLKNKKCSAYEGRPIQCRTWPFWPDTMQSKAWKKEVVSFCPGVNKGKVHTKKQIEQQMQEQEDAEDEIFI